MLERSHEAAIECAPANRVATAEGMPAGTNGLMLLASLFVFFAVVFSVWPQIDIIIAQAISVDRATPLYGTVSSAREAFKTVFALCSLLVALAAMPLLLGGEFSKRLLSTAALFVASVLAVGPGVITNLLLKVYWGRARPHQVAEFGGDKVFSPVTIPSDQTSWNGSMPSGEAASIFGLFFALSAIAPAPWRRPLLFAGIGLGGCAGLVRMAQAGHWMSDVIAAGLLMYAVAFGLRRLLVDQPRGPFHCLASLPAPDLGALAGQWNWAAGPRAVLRSIHVVTWTITLLSMPQPLSAMSPSGFAATLPQLHSVSEPAYLETNVCEKCGPVSHAGSLVRRGNELHAFWFRGSAEAKWDVSIQHAVFDGKTWSEARKVISTEELARELHRYNKTLANPVAVAMPDGELILFITAVSMRGFATAYLVAKRSSDGGKTWSAAQRIITSPIWNISTLTKTAPVRLENGNIVLPVHFELTAKWLKYPFLAEIDPESLRAKSIRRMGTAGSGLQPALAPMSATHAVAYLRKNWGVGDAIGLRKIETLDGGQTWSEPAESGYKNPGGPVGLVSLGGEDLALTFNETSEQSLSLAVSRNAGARWMTLGPLSQSSPASQADGMEAYPFAIVGEDGIVDVICSGENQSAMRHIRFNRALIDHQRLGISANVR